MIKQFNEFSTNAIFKIANEELLQTYSLSEQIGLFTFIWATDTPTEIEIDGVATTLKKNSIAVLTPTIFFRFIGGQNAIVYQFNREFYCIKDHDEEVSCMGILFYGNATSPIIELSKEEHHKLQLLHQVFLDELDTVDNIQAEMLRILMARFIITTTRLIKQQSNFKHMFDGQLNMIREFNVLVNSHFRKEHSVSFYAKKLFKSPKTLSNTFAKYKKSPLQIIHDRIILEAKRLLIYSDKPTKEIAYEIGFDDPSHLSRMFKKRTSLSPSEFRKNFNKDKKRIPNEQIDTFVDYLEKN
ncbi:helix-turn-helix domain-containing protein [Aquimarina hainanensis]|uniref:Helix-turn-helix domain-containing protein n=1 Tax=Aquimarina hainanensis TaxID=1578017 RepID=A0ABW5N7S0_9FLAO